MTRLLIGAFCAAFFTLSLSAQAAWPDKPVRLIVPLSAGGGMDTVARAVATPLTEKLGQSVVVDNRAGGGGAIGAELTKEAPKDGHTLLMASATFVIHPLLYPARYVPTRDYATITQVTRQPYVLMVYPGIPVKTVRELVAYAKAHPSSINYASAGQGSLIHLTTELFKARTGVSMNHVPYKGMGGAYIDMLSGRIQAAFPSIISVLPHLKTGKLRALAVSSAKRSSSLPDIPSLQEAGIRDFDVSQWYGLFAPVGTPRPIIDRIHHEVIAILKTAEMQKRMAGDGADGVGSTPAEFAGYVKAESARWTEVIRKSNIKAD
jgi:tripartite-type tricarboxylate transporter receptor subunit TctC